MAVITRQTRRNLRTWAVVLGWLALSITGLAYVMVEPILARS